MVLKGRPTLRIVLQIGTVLLLLVMAAAAVDLLSRLGVHYPNLVGFSVLFVVTLVVVVRSILNRKKTL
jgi:hypothetical protein